MGTLDSAPGNGRWPEVGRRSNTRRVWGRRSSTDARRSVVSTPRAHWNSKCTEGRWARHGSLSVSGRGAKKALVILDEHPLRGLGGSLHNTVVDAFAQIRHHGMLRRLAEAVEGTPQGTG